MRFDKFRVLLQSPELEICRRKMEEKGVHADLAELLLLLLLWHACSCQPSNHAPGKMFGRPT